MKKSILFFLFTAVAKNENDSSKKHVSLLKSFFMLCTATLLFSCTANDEPISEETSFLNQIKTSFNPNTFTDFGGGENWDIDWNNYTELTKDSTQIYTFALKAKNETKIQSDLFQEKVVHQIIGFKKGQKALTYLLEVKSNIESSLYTNDIAHLGNFNGIASVYTFKKELLGTITFNSGKANNYSQNKELDALTAVFNLYYVPKLNSKIPACRATVMIYDLRYQDIYTYTVYNGITSDIAFRERKLIDVTSYTTTVIYPCDSPSNTDEKYIPHITPVYLKIDASKNPCDQLKTQNTNADFKSKITELATKTKLKKETGYAQKTDGSYQSLTNSGGDQLNFATDATTIGFMHTHLDPYESGNYDPDGNPEIRSPIKMFSPADVKSFISLLINANRNNIPLSDVYGTMVASNGVYQLRFEGNYSDINTGLNFDGLKEKYRDYFRRFSNPEKAFALFLKDQIGINGISLYKLKSDGTSEKKSLDTNNKLTTTPCQ